MTKYEEAMQKNDKKINSVLRYPGAKNRLANWILSYIPKHGVYVEPFAGSLAVLLNKGRCHIETVNDLNDDVVNFFQVLRDYPEELMERIRLTPYSRTEYIRSYEDCDDFIEKARRFAVRCWMGFGGSNVYQNGFKSGQQTNSPNPAKAWSILPNALKMAADRLRGVQIEHLPALEIIDRYNTKDVFMYLDPPYLPRTRKSHLYKHEMSKNAHILLLEKIVSHLGKILISGYDNELYDSYLKGWNKISCETQVEQGQKRTEFLWKNYDFGQMTLGDFI